MPLPLKPLLPLLRGSRLTFPLAVVAALGMFLISESTYQQSISTFDRLGQRGQARTNVQLLLRSLIDAETGQRGYLLTGRPEYLEPYRRADARVGETLKWLDSYYNNNPADDAIVERIKHAAESKLSELTATVRLYDQGKREDWRAVVMSNIGKEELDTVRVLSQQLLDHETDAVAVDRKTLGDSLLLNRIGVSAMTALSLLALYMYLRQTTALVRQREEQRLAVQEERDHFAHEVRLRTEQLTDLNRHLQSVREDERHRLARELHDELGALLTAAKLDVARLKSRLGQGVSPEIGERLSHLSDGLNSGIALKRRIIEDLRPSSLSNLGLVSALDILVREWGQRSEIKVDADFEPVQLRPAGELTVYRLVQEALTNIAKYAKATEVVVRLSSVNGRVRVLVRDNGIGFNLDAPRISAHGLLGMRYRLETEGGQLSMRSSPGAGTSIEADMPESEELAPTTVPGQLD
jgi:signal transduction histidine kinase